MSAVATYKVPARTLLCAIAACILTVIFLGEFGQASVPSAPHAALLQA